MSKTVRLKYTIGFLITFTVVTGCSIEDNQEYTVAPIITELPIPEETVCIIPTPFSMESILISSDAVDFNALLCSEGDNYPIPTEDKYRDEKGSLIKDENYIEINEELWYVHYRGGYKIRIPNYWENYVLVKQSDNTNCIDVYFYGKSIVGKGWFYSFIPTVGKYMFSIYEEDVYEENSEFCDRIGNLGTINSINYYAVTSTGVETLEVFVSEIENGTSDFLVSEIETNYILSDSEMLLRMWDDVDEILESFSSIE